MTAFFIRISLLCIEVCDLFACSAAGIYFGVGRAKAKKKES